MYLGCCPRDFSSSLAQPMASSLVSRKETSRCVLMDFLSSFQRRGSLFGKAILESSVLASGFGLISFQP